jgi:hypothetical protein
MNATMIDPTYIKSWEEMTVLEQMQCQYWDMYKEAYNFRPRGIDTSGWTEERFMDEFASLEKIFEANYQERLRSEDAAIARFEEQILSLMVTNASMDRAAVLRWIHEAEGSNGDDEYLCFLLGLPYSYLKTPKV